LVANLPVGNEDPVRGGRAAAFGVVRVPDRLLGDRAVDRLDLTVVDVLGQRVVAVKRASDEPLGPPLDQRVQVRSLSCPLRFASSEETKPARSVIDAVPWIP
jgi:hypothetical protein